MNKKQIKKIENYLHQTTWPYILDNIVTKKDLNERGDLNKESCFDMEKILKSLAATFGLAAYPDYDDEDYDEND